MNGNEKNTKPMVLNKKTMPATQGRVPNTVYIGRPSMWGNPFVIGKDGSRADVIAKYEKWLLAQPQLMARLDLLQGKSLVCWCAPLACHGDVLLRLSNSTVRRCD